MKDKLLIGFMFLFMINIASASEIDYDSYLSCPEDKTCIYLFWGQGCPHCAEIKEFLNTEYENSDEVIIKDFEVYFNKNNQELFKYIESIYGCEIEGVPTVFVDDKHFVGASPKVEADIKNEVLSCIKEGCSTPLKMDTTPQTEEKCEENKLTLPAIITAAAVDSINPCAFSVMIFLLVYLLSLDARRRILKVGITYISVVFIVYFISGLGLLTFIQSVKITNLVFDVAAAIAILAGLVNVKDYFYYGRGLTLSIPKSKRKELEKYIKMASVPAAIVLGILVSMYELPCTGGVYLAILSLLADTMTRTSAIPYLFIYNVIFVLPLFVILYLVYEGLSPEKLEHWRKEKRKDMKLASGVVMIALGILMLIGWL